MANMPFELVGRRVMNDALRERYPLACMCGAEVNMFFGSPRVARNMLRALKREAQADLKPHRCQSPLLN